MLSFVTSQAIALSQVKPRSPPTRDVVPYAPPQRRFISRLFDALFKARLRRAEIEIEHHRRFYEGHTK
jgi:hypothetical protein